MESKKLIVEISLVVITAILTWAVTFSLILPGVLTDKRIEQAATAYADFNRAFVKLIGLQSSISKAEDFISDNKNMTQEEKAWATNLYYDLKARTIDAEIEFFSTKARIAVYGDPETIKHVIEISGKGDNGVKVNMVKAQKAMRAQFGADEVSDINLKKLLFKD